MAVQAPPTSIDDTSKFMEWFKDRTETGQLRGGEADHTEPEIDTSSAKDDIITQSKTKTDDVDKSPHPDTNGDSALYPTAAAVISGANMLDKEEQKKAMTPTQLKLIIKMNNPETKFVSAVEDVDVRPNVDTNEATTDLKSGPANTNDQSEPKLKKPTDKPSSVMAFFDEKLKEMEFAVEQHIEPVQTSEVFKPVEIKREFSPPPASVPTRQPAAAPEKSSVTFGVADLLENLQKTASKQTKSDQPPSPGLSLNPRAEAFVSGSDCGDTTTDNATIVLPDETIPHQWIQLTQPKPAEARTYFRKNSRSVLPEEPKQVTSESRLVVLSNLPRDDIDYTFVQSLIRGGTIESMTLSKEQGVAHIWFTNPESSSDFVKNHKAGLKINHNGVVFAIIVTGGKDYNQIDPTIQAYIDCGATRVLRAQNFHDGVTVRGLYTIARGVSATREVESLTDFIQGSSTRVTVFRMTNISDAVDLRKELLAQPDYLMSQNLQFQADPCAAKTLTGM